jgi:hypothetical protein
LKRNNLQKRKEKGEESESHKEKKVNLVDDAEL